MKIKKSLFKFGLAALFVGAIFNLATITPAQAAVDKGQIAKKWQALMVLNCMGRSNNARFPGKITVDADSDSKYNNAAGSIFTAPKKENYYKGGTDDDAKTYLAFPSDGYLDEFGLVGVKDENKNFQYLQYCKQVITGGNGYSGVLHNFFPSYETTQLNDTNASEILGKFGFKLNEGTAFAIGGQITELLQDEKQKENGTADPTTPAPVQSSTIVKGGDGYNVKSDSDSTTLEVYIKNDTLNIKVCSLIDGYENEITYNPSGAVWRKHSNDTDFCGTTKKYYEFSMSLTGELKNDPKKLIQAVNSAISGTVFSVTTENKSLLLGTITSTHMFTINSPAAVITDGEFVADKTDNKAGKASAYSIYGDSTYAINEEEKYDMYLYYLRNALLVSENRISCSDPGGYTKVVLKDDDGKYREYYAQIQSTKLNQKYIVLDKHGKTIKAEKLSWIINNFFNRDLDKDSGSRKPEAWGENETCHTPTDLELTVETEDEEDGPCFNGAGSLGWILCPVIRLVREAIGSLYDNIVEPFLQIGTDLIGSTTPTGSGSQPSPTYKAWGYFRDFGNIVFTILLLVVIFSQITGVGIDNLGIKRILPKLIIAAILINASYIICQIAVDLSNILGYSLNNLFNSLSQNIASSPTSGLNASNGSVGATIISAAIGVGGGAAAIATIELWGPMMIIMLLVGLITMLVSIFFTFVILGIRRAAVVVLVVISPVALVLYMLPNTRKLFDRWYKAFIALLLVYPIVGMLMGGGAFVGTLIWELSLNGEGEGAFITQISAAIITIAPFFLIPSLLKGSLSGIGNIGAKISNIGSRMGNTLGRTAGKGVQSSAAFKDFQARNAQRAQQRIVDRVNARENFANGRIANSRVGKRLGLNSVSSQAQLRRARAQQQLSKMQTERLMAEEGAIAPMSEDVERQQIKARIADQQADALMSGISMDESSNYGENLGILQDRLQNAFLSGDSSAQRAYMNHLSTKGDKGRTAVATAFENAMSASGGDLDKSAYRNFASTVTGSKFGKDYKANARSTFDLGSKINGVGSEKEGSSIYGDIKPSIGKYGSAGSLTSNNVVNGDDREIDRLTQAITNGSMSDGDFMSAYSAVYNAMTDPRLSQNMKDSRRMQLQSFMSAVGSSDRYKNLASQTSMGMYKDSDFGGGRVAASGGDNTEVKIDHSSGAASSAGATAGASASAGAAAGGSGGGASSGTASSGGGSSVASANASTSGSWSRRSASELEAVISNPNVDAKTRAQATTALNQKNFVEPNQSTIDAVKNANGQGVKSVMDEAASVATSEGISMEQALSRVADSYAAQDEANGTNNHLIAQNAQEAYSNEKLYQAAQSASDKEVGIAQALASEQETQAQNLAQARTEAGTTSGAPKTAREAVEAVQRTEASKIQSEPEQISRATAEELNNYAKQRQADIAAGKPGQDLETYLNNRETALNTKVRLSNNSADNIRLQAIRRAKTNLGNYRSYEASKGVNIK